MTTKWEGLLLTADPKWRSACQVSPYIPTVISLLTAWTEMKLKKCKETQIHLFFLNGRSYTEEAGLKEEVVEMRCGIQTLNI